MPTHPSYHSIWSRTPYARALGDPTLEEPDDWPLDRDAPKVCHVDDDCDPSEDDLLNDNL